MGLVSIKITFNTPNFKLYSKWMLAVIYIHSQSLNRRDDII